MDSFQGLYNIRDATKEDHNFIFSSFLNGLYHGDSWFSQIPRRIFMDNYKKIIQTAVVSSKITIKIACLPEDTNVIIGYSILSADFKAVVWVFVKPRWRKKGIARSLVPKSPEVVTHLTELGRILLPKLPETVFNPFY